MGTWFTQLFYYPWLGVTVLCGWWLLLLWLLKKTFNVSARWTALLLIPVALLLLTDVDQGYWIYMLKLRGHFFLTTIATVSVVALLWGFRSMPDKYWLRTIWLVLTGIVGYPLLGIYGLAATLLMGIWSWRLMGRGRAAIHTVIAILLSLHVSDGLPAIRHQPSAISHQESMVALGCTGRSVGHRGVGRGSFLVQG